MKAISTKEFRDNMQKILKKASRGQKFLVMYRSEVMAVLGPPKKIKDYNPK